MVGSVAAFPPVKIETEMDIAHQVTRMGDSSRNIRFALSQTTFPEPVTIGRYTFQVIVTDATYKCDTLQRHNDDVFLLTLEGDIVLHRKIYELQPKPHTYVDREIREVCKSDAI